MSDTPISFDGIFPLPFRVFFLFGLGIILWAANLHILGSEGVDVATVLDLRASGSVSLRHTGTGLRASTLHFPLYKVFVTYSACWLVAWLLFINMVHGNTLLVDTYRHIPGICALVMLIGLITPLDIFHKRERERFLL
jgi:hypothetical protein